MPTSFTLFNTCVLGHARTILRMIVSLFIIFFSPAVSMAIPSPVSDKELEEDLIKLDKELIGRNELVRQRREIIASLKTTAHNNPVAPTLIAVGEAYIGVNIDSALHYLYAGQDNITDSLQLDKLHMRIAEILPYAGLAEEAEKVFSSIDTTRLDPTELADYYEAGYKTYSNIGEFFSKFKTIERRYDQTILDFQTKLLRSLHDTPESNRYRLVFGDYILRKGNTELAETILRDVFATEESDSPERIHAAQLLARIMEKRKDYNSQIFYLIRAVRGELHRGNIALPSLHMLGTALTRRGDEERAFRYLNTALSNASEEGTYARLVESASTIPIVQEEHVERLESNRRLLLACSIVLAILLIALAFFLWRTRREAIKLRVANSNLGSAKRTRDIYMAQFLSLCTVYMDSISNFSAMVKRKIAAGKASEVNSLLQSDRYVNEQTAQFFSVFDDAFLHIYPNFPEEINKLLQPDKAIILKDGERMNTDLRILAFMRMGIDDSSRIARILNYSVNTIYTYRNKLKSRALNRDTFESEIMKIQGI